MTSCIEEPKGRKGTSLSGRSARESAETGKIAERERKSGEGEEGGSEEVK